MNRRRDVTSFAEEVRRHFTPLREEIGLEGGPEPEIIPGIPPAEYRADNVVYRIVRVPDDQAVLTTVDLLVADGKLVADLEEVVIAAGLGVRQDVPTNARSFRLMRRSLAGQAEWIRRLHPILTGPEGADIMRRADARLVTRDD